MMTPLVQLVRCVCAAESERESKPYNILYIRLHSNIALNWTGVITVPV